MTRIELHQRRVKIAKFVENGGSYEAAARVFKVCTMTVSNSCKHLGPEPSLMNFSSTRKIMGIIKRLMNEDASFQEVGDSFSVTRQYVQQLHKVANEVGLEVRSRSA